MNREERIIDAHLHLWDPKNTPRDVSILLKLFGFNQNLVDRIANIIFPKKIRNFFASPEYITRPYKLEQYKLDSKDHNIEGVIHVEASWKGKGKFAPVDETKWVQSLNSQMDPKILAIIAYANLHLGEQVEEVIKAHIKASDLVRGIRETLSWQPDPSILNGAKSNNIMKDPNWLKGFETLSKFDLSIEVTIYDYQIQDITELANTYRQQKIMLSHLATPVAVGGQFGDRGKTVVEREKIFKDWQENMAQLAECKNVYLKMSGMAMPICGFGWEFRDKYPSVNEIVDKFSPFYNFALNSFGYERCLFASNFPVDKVSLSLDSLIDAFNIIFKNIPDDKRELLFYKNAMKFYNIKSDK